MTTKSLDPTDWDAFRGQAHRMLDDMIDYLAQIRERPVWQPIPDTVREQLRAPLPVPPSSLEDAHNTFMHAILPYSVGNAHPGFMGWVHGGGTPVGMLAEMLAGGLNANLGGRDQMPIEVERQVLQWVRELFGFPDSASGIFVTGTSMANLISLLVARTATLGEDVRQNGIDAAGRKLVAYASEAAHSCISKAMDFCGLGTDALRRIPLDAQQRLDTQRLRRAIGEDRARGLVPFYLVGTAGTVDTGAIDDLETLADIARQEKLWFHVDGAFGALGVLAPSLAPRFKGIERADSIAFDFHKWGQVPYDAGFILIRDGEQHRRTFTTPAAYLSRESQGLAAGSPWPCDFGPDLSRGFRALKAWFTLKVYGTRQLGEMIANTCDLARYLAERVENEPKLELLAPVSLNVVCFRYRGEDMDNLNRALAVALQESGVAAPSTTTLNGRIAIRAAIVNHRTNTGDIDNLLEATLALGAKLTQFSDTETTHDC
ncbi:pyridoxal phosphate-dependent decarboxylase family protein [Mangrovitalea sediminis]|uniref:pyridoxal phosphate-dependent decarboxylase family protein n=1 Tax=Mangrovitalea sediminis TaxID=1982043 RepID=UPI0018E9A25B|nr:aspartate aminotransferase family protein [Mangrovitalea sediminis]